MKLRWTTPAVETIDDKSARRIFVSVRDNLHDIASNVMSKDELVSAGVLKVDKDGNYISTSKTIASAAVTSSSYTTVSWKYTPIIITATLTPGTYYTDLYLPQNSRVIKSWYEVTSAFTGVAGAAMSVRFLYDGTNATDIVSSSAIGSGWASGLHDGVQTGLAASFSQKMTAARPLEYVVSTNNVLSGRAVIFIQYAIIN